MNLTAPELQEASKMRETERKDFQAMFQERFA